MKRKKNKFLFWAPRILGIGFVLFLMLFSLDILEMDLSGWQLISALLMHNIPAFILMLIIIIAWKKELVGAAIFIGAGLFYMFNVLLVNDFKIYMVSWILSISFPAFLVGSLFYLSWSSNNKEKLSIYCKDLREKGIGYFVLSRLKKHGLTRKILAVTFKSYVLVQNKKLFIDKMDNVVSETLLNTGSWEPYYTDIFTSFSQKSRTVVDIGAHIGYYTLIAALNVKKGGRVFAFEPCRRTSTFLERTISENNLKNIVLVNKAVDKTTGKAKLFLNDSNIGEHSLVKILPSDNFQETKTISLDDYFSDYPLVIDLMKIDIQGNEVNALKGMKKLLAKRKIRVIMTELWPKGLMAAGSSWVEYVTLLKKAGFSIWETDVENKKLVKFNESVIKKNFAADNEFITNLICTLS